MDNLVVPNKCYISGPNNSEFWSEVQMQELRWWFSSVYWSPSYCVLLRWPLVTALSLLTRAEFRFVVAMNVIVFVYALIQLIHTVVVLALGNTYPQLLLVLAIGSFTFDAVRSVCYPHTSIRWWSKLQKEYSRSCSVITNTLHYTQFGMLKSWKRYIRGCSHLAQGRVREQCDGTSYWPSYPGKLTTKDCGWWL
jgi:hypothetical protein